MTATIGLTSVALGEEKAIRVAWPSSDTSDVSPVR
jgi:hypothetical protein